MSTDGFATKDMEINENIDLGEEYYIEVSTAQVTGCEIKLLHLNRTTHVPPPQKLYK